MSLAAAPDGSVLVLSAGATRSVAFVDGRSSLGEVRLEDAFLGLTFAPNGRFVYAGGGSRGSVYELSYSPGELKVTREMKAGGFIGDVAVSPDGRLIYAADIFGNQIAVINPQSGRVIDHFRVGRRPYKILFHPDGQSFFVSSWADASVYQYRTINGEELGRVRIGPHATGMVISDRKPAAENGAEPPGWKYRLFAAAAGTNSVYVIAIGENRSMREIENINLAPQPLSAVSLAPAPLGMTPSALALSPDQTHLYVACSGADVIADVNLTDVRSVVNGYAPSGHYPAAVLALADGRVLSANAKSNDVTAAGAFGRLAQPKLRQSSEPSPHVVYMLENLPPEEFMRAVAGTAPDFTVKLAGRPEFNLNDPANTPMAGFLWTNALAAGLTVRVYGLSIRDPALAGYTNPRGAEGFLDDLKQFEMTAAMPRLIVVQAADPTLRARIADAIRNSRFGAMTRIFDGKQLFAAEAALGLRPMTRND
jgi:YVTN family beta-propeller protein